MIRSRSVPAQPGRDPADLPDAHEKPARFANHVQRTHLSIVAHPMRRGK
jgi:hypothetical protein